MIRLSYKLETKDLYEYVMGIMLKKTILFGLCIGIFGMLFFTLLFPNQTLFVVSLICVLTAVLIGPMTVWEIKQKGKTVNGTNQETTVIFEDQIRMIEEGINLEMAYTEITKIEETKNLYAFMLGKNNGIVIPKRVLSEDEYNEVVSLIHEHKASI